MSTATRVTIAAVVLLAAAAGVWFLVEGREPLAPPELAAEHAARAPNSVEPQQPAAELARADESGSRAEVPVESAPPAASAETAPAADTTARVDGRFTDAAGRGIARVRVVKPDQLDGRFAESDEQGDFVLTLAPGSPLGLVSFEARADGWATHFSLLTATAGATFHRGQILLVPGGTIAGVVVDENGRPLPGARVLGTKPDMEGEVTNLRRSGPSKQWSLPETVSLVDGTFRLEGVPAELARAWAWRDGMRWAFSDLITVPARGAVEGVVLKLEPLAADDRIEGIVLDPDGQPVPRAAIGYSYDALDQGGSSSARAGDDGRFRIVLLRKVPHDLHCGPGGKNWSSASLEDVPPGTLDAVLQMRAARMIDVLALDEKGGPLGAFAFSLRSAEGDYELWGGKEEPRAEGRASFKLPSMPFLVDVWARGRTRVELGPIDPAALPAQLVCTLESLPGLRGRVLHGKTPVAGANLLLHRMVPVNQRYEHNGYPSRIQGPVVEHDVSDAEGRFQVTVREPGIFALLCDAPGYALAEISPVDVDPRVGRDGLDVYVGAGGAIEGRVLAPTGRDAAGVIVGITRFDCRARTVRVGADGRFRFEQLTPGGWSVRRATKELHPGSTTTSSGDAPTPVRFDADCIVSEGRVTDFDLDLRADFDAVLVGRVTVNGAPATGWTVVAQTQGEAAAFSLGPPTGVVDSQGDVRIELPRSTTYRIELMPVAEHATTLRWTTEVAVHAGENRWGVDLDCGTLEGTVTGDGERRSIACTSLAVGDWKCSGSVWLDAEGRFRLAFLPVGQARVTLSERQVGNVWRTTSEKQVEIARGAIATVQLP